MLRRREVEQITGLSRSSLYALIATGRFPPPYRLSARAVAWRLSEVTEWIDQLPSNQ
ncbi:helix-turn-helix transcriptional regulator [Arhodomonas sp. SL1]|uniref:helix-turn-helix transcriptional regulator n=1 Tax=Arhodomonas sp. SL1 TaxID=3425691 RepID=UPI003F885443